MKKLTALMMTIMIALSLAACASGTPTADSSSQVQETEFTAEQQALAQDFTKMTEEYDVIVDRVNAIPEELRDEMLIKNMNELADQIIQADGYFAAPETLTSEVMEGLKTIVEAIRTFITEADTTLSTIESANHQGETVVVPVEITNLTSMDIYTLALSPANDSEWGNNLITEAIKSGETVGADLSFTKDTLTWDILIQDVNQNRITFRDIDFSNVSTDGAKLVLESTESGSYFASVS